MAPPISCECGECRKCKKRVYMREYYERNRVQYLEQIRERRALNPEPFRRRNREWERTHREQAYERHKRWVDANHDSVRAYRRKWKLLNPDAVRDYRARRRASKAHAEITGPVRRLEIFARDGGRCHICGQRCSEQSFHLDHLVPISKGGAHSPENVAVAHPACNLRRGAGVIPAQLRLH